MATGIDISKQIAILDEGTQITPNVNKINFTGTGITATASGNDVTVNVVGATGVWGIANTAGVYTFYSTLTLAMAAATSGQTIEMFADVTETGAVTITLKNGVTINGNSHTYTINNTTTHNFLIDNNVAITFRINNLIVRKIGVQTVDTDNYLINQLNTNSNFDFSNSYFYSTATVGRINGRLTGGYYNGFGNTFIASCTLLNYGIISDINVEIGNYTGDGSTIYGFVNYGTLQNCNITTSNIQGLRNLGGSVAKNINVVSTNNVAFTAVYNDGELMNCTINSVVSSLQNNSGHAYNCSAYSSGGIAISNGNYLYNSVGRSAASDGIRGTNSTNKIVNCSGFSSALIGINTEGEAINSFGMSTVNFGISSFLTGIFKECTSISTAATAAANGATWYNCTFQSTWNNAAGRAFDCQYGQCTLINSSFKVANTSANCIYNAAVKTIKYANNAFDGATTPVNANITQGVTNTHDNQGNILI